MKLLFFRLLHFVQRIFNPAFLLWEEFVCLSKNVSDEQFNELLYDAETLISIIEFFRIS